jgi:hypothetical protein
MVNHGPCGRCKKLFPRDDLHGINVKFFSPDDTQDRLPIRACQPCRVKIQEKLEQLRWDNSEMVQKPVEISTTD